MFTRVLLPHLFSVSLMRISHVRRNKKTQKEVMLDKNILGILSAEQQNTGQNKFRPCLAAAHTHNN